MAEKDFWGQVVDFGKNLLKPIWNFDVEETREKAHQAEADIIQALEESARNYPQFRDLMQQYGFLNPDNTVNVSKVRDSGYLDLLKGEIAKNQGQLQQQLSRQTAIQNATTGISGSGNISNRKALADAQRQAMLDYANLYKQEEERAYQKALGLGSQLAGATQSDYMTKTNLRNLAKQQAFQTAAANAAAEAQNKGILQDTQKASDLAGKIISIIPFL